MEEFVEEYGEAIISAIVVIGVVAIFLGLYMEHGVFYQLICNWMEDSF